MKHICLIYFIVLLGNIFHLNAQGPSSALEKSFSKIKVKQGTTDVNLKNDYGKRWKMRVNYPEVTKEKKRLIIALHWAGCLLYTSPSPRDGLLSRMPSS